MTTLRNGFGDSRLDASIAAIIGPSGDAPSVRVPRGGMLRRSQTASVTAAAALGLALLASTLVLLRRHEPAPSTQRPERTAAPASRVVAVASTHVDQPPAVPAAAVRPAPAAGRDAGTAMTTIARPPAAASGPASGEAPAAAIPPPSDEAHADVTVRAPIVREEPDEPASTWPESTRLTIVEDPRSRPDGAALLLDSPESPASPTRLRRLRQDTVATLRALRRQW